MADVRTVNVVVLGVGFLLIFTAFTTCGNIEVCPPHLLTTFSYTIQITQPTCFFSWFCRSEGNCDIYRFNQECMGMMIYIKVCNEA